VARYGLDTEFSTGRRYATTLALVQLSFPGETVLVDSLRVDLAPLRELFTSNATMLAHSALNDLDILDVEVGVRPTRLFDTQVAGALLGYPQPSLNLLTTDLLGITLDKTLQRTDWLVRPLGEGPLNYAASDVDHLFELVDRLSAQLNEKNRMTWVEQECAALLLKRRPDPAPEELWWHLTRAETIPRSKQLNAQRLCMLRDTWARRVDKPPTVVLSDQAVVALAKKPPRRVDEVSRLGGNRGIERRFAEAVIECLAAAHVEGELHPTTFSRLDDELGPLHLALSAIANQRATDLDVDPGLLASRGDVSDYLNRQPSRLDLSWRKEAIGDDFDALRDGRAVVAVHNDHLVVVPR
jgi:ribonuclease D